MTIAPLRALSLDELRLRTSEKWREYPADVLPLFVAETDFPLAPAVSSALTQAIATGDTGYIASRTPLPEVFAAFAQRRYGWNVDARQVWTTADVSMGIVEILRRVIAPGERVIVTPPVYPPFFDLVAEAQGVDARVPLIDSGDSWQLDLDGIEREFAAGARAILLCNPHNPTGTAHSRAALEALAALAARYGASVISDEIHAPLTQPGSGFVPFLAVSDEARAVGFSVTSASKAFNLAGLKCALMVTAASSPAKIVRELPVEVTWRTGQFGLLAALASFDEASDPWLDSLLAALDENRRLLRDLLTVNIPAARYRIPDAGYLAWIDLSEAGLGDNPSKRILREAKVALHFGPAFGEQGRGHVRLNFGTSPEIISEAVRRMAMVTAQ